MGEEQTAVDSEIDVIKKGERKFLHDISNDVVVAQGMCMSVLKKLRDNRPLEEKDTERLEKTIDAINRITKQIKERRTVLIGSSDIII